MPDLKWKAAQPSAQVVQQHYVNARAHELNKIGREARKETVKALAQNLQISHSDAETAFDILTATLQAREITINFHATRWFATENRYASYTQMYQRGVDPVTGEILLVGDALNPPQARALYDDFVTLPAEWNHAPEEGHRSKIYKKGGAGGLSPGIIQPGHALQSHMRLGKKIPTGPGELLTPVQKADGTNAFKPKNRKFNPDTRQIFVALNYGRRPHGSSCQYGSSHLVVNPKFKPNAIYFAGDTFGKVSTNTQVSYKTLAALYPKAAPQLRDALRNSCLDQVHLPDTSMTDLLVEAHIFDAINFGRGDIVELRLESAGLIRQQRMADAKKYGWDPSKPRTTDVVANAKNFCARWGIKFTQV